MDQFGVLVESIGFKAQGKSAPMADLKSKTKATSGFPQNIGINSDFDSKPNLNSAYDLNSISGSFVDDLDGVFRSNTGREAQNSDIFDGYGDFLGVPFSNLKPSEGNNSGLGSDLDSVFKGSRDLGRKSSVTDLYDDGDYMFGEKPAQMSSESTNLGKKSSVTSLYDDGDYMFGEMPSQMSSGSINLGKKPSVTDLNDNGDGFFGGTPAQKSSDSANFDDMFGSMASPSRQSGSVDDLLGDFKGMGISSNKNSTKVEETMPESDDLIPGFGGSSPPSNGAKSAASPSQCSSGHSSQSTSNLAEDPFGVFQSSSAQAHPSDPFEDFGTGQSDDLETFFRKSAQPTDVSKQRSTTKDPVYDTLFPGRGPSGPKPNAAETSSRMRKTSPTPNLVDDFSALFGEAAPSSEEFQEIEGESEERRKARLNHHKRTQARMAKALAEKNHRDLQTQQEQEERRRLAEILESDIKQWAAGKEGNLRALLSSLQYVLGSECGWQPVSLTDLITSVSVKKVYYKATLCVHPDKVQQKGATLQQKFIAEKVFDLLKEAWNKFNAEEM